MEQLDENALFKIAIYLDYSELLQFCSSSKRINRLVCRKDSIWLFMLNRDYPDWRDFQIEKTLMDTYKVLHDLNILKKKLGLYGSLLDIYNRIDMNLIRQGIGELPKEIGQLVNLQELILLDNKLKTLPKEIGQLTNLRDLDLTNNHLSELPKEIGKLVNLEILTMYNNRIRKLPKEIGNLINLRKLYMPDNELKELPEEIEQLTNLRLLDVRDNNITSLPEILIKHMKNNPNLVVRRY